VALVGAGHTSISPFFDPVLAFRTYPLQLYGFSDGVFVQRAAPGYERLLGARVLRVGTQPIEDALRSVATVFGHENDALAKLFGLRYLMIPEIVGALHIAPDMEQLTLEVERAGRRESVVIRPAGAVAFHGHESAGMFDHVDWASMRRA